MANIEYGKSVLQMFARWILKFPFILSSHQSELVQKLEGSLACISFLHLFWVIKPLLALSCLFLVLTILELHLINIYQCMSLISVPLGS